MTLMKRPNFSFLMNEKWMNDFFDNGRFFDSDLTRMMAVPGLPAVNIVENEKEFVIEMAVPGMRKEDFNIGVENKVLTISVQREMEKYEEKKNFTRKEYSYEEFSRSFTLPENASEEKIKAHYEDGILKLHLAKKELTAMPAKKAIHVA